MSRKSVLITGCSEGGIGHALALEWNSKGYRVFATARKIEAMAGFEDVGIDCVSMDVTDYSSLNAAKAIVEERTNGKLDILVNNAGQGDSNFWTRRIDKSRLYNAYPRCRYRCSKENP